MPRVPRSHNCGVDQVPSRPIAGTMVRSAQTGRSVGPGAGGTAQRLVGQLGRGYRDNHQIGAQKAAAIQMRGVLYSELTQTNPCWSKTETTRNRPWRCGREPQPLLRKTHSVAVLMEPATGHAQGRGRESREKGRTRGERGERCAVEEGKRGRGRESKVPSSCRSARPRRERVGGRGGTRCRRAAWPVLSTEEGGAERRKGWGP